MASRAQPGGRANPLGAAMGLTLVTALVVAGFWPSFFANPAGLDAAHLAHGIAASGWMLLLILQPLLLALGARGTHRLIGRISPLWLGFLVATATAMTAAMLAIPPAQLPPPYALAVPPAWVPLAPGGPVEMRLVLAAIDTATLVLVMVFYSLAMLIRDRAIHARLLGATALLAVIPALGRLFAGLLPGLNGLAGALEPSFWVVDAMLVALLWLDWRDGRRAWVWQAVLALMLGLEWAMWQAPLWPWFRAVAGLLGWQPLP